MVFLGVDGGGTKTALCLVAGDGRLLAEGRAPGLDYLDSGISVVRRVLGEGIGDLCAQAEVRPEQIDFAFVGIPTYGEIAGDAATLDAIPREVLGHDRYRCDNDMVCGWAGSLSGEDGINVIAGTGSMTYGRRDRAQARVGGWGHVFGDEGSAYWIAIRGLNLATRMSDGRTPEGPLCQMLRDRLGLADDFELVDVIVNRWRGSRREIAALSRLVTAAADAGDREAEAILDEAGRELALLVDTTRRQLGYRTGEPVPVSWSGGVLSVDRVRDALCRALTALSESYRLREPRFDPAIGAALFAARLSGRPLDDEALDRLERDAARRSD